MEEELETLAEEKKEETIAEVTEESVPEDEVSE